MSCNCGKWAVQAFQDSMLETLEAFNPRMVFVVEGEAVDLGNDSALELNVPSGQQSQNQHHDAA